MSLIPTPPWGLGVVTLVFLAGVGLGATVNGWRLNGQIAEVQREAAEKLAAERVAALDEYTRLDKELKAAGVILADSEAKLKAQLSTIRKDRTNAPPLPADCKPDPVRLRSLERAIGAANSAIRR